MSDFCLSRLVVFSLLFICLLAYGRRNMCIDQIALNFDRWRLIFSENEKYGTILFFTVGWRV